MYNPFHKAKLVNHKCIVLRFGRFRWSTDMIQIWTTLRCPGACDVPEHVMSPVQEGYFRMPVGLFNIHLCETKNANAAGIVVWLPWEHSSFLHSTCVVSGIYSIISRSRPFAYGTLLVPLSNLSNRNLHILIIMMTSQLVTGYYIFIYVSILV